MCVDFIDLNLECSKNPFSLSIINITITNILKAIHSSVFFHDLKNSILYLLSLFHEFYFLNDINVYNYNNTRLYLNIYKNKIFYLCNISLCDINIWDTILYLLIFSC